MPGIYVCGELDRERVLEYIAFEPEVNLFIYGDIESFGMADPVHIVAFENGGASWDAVALRFFGSYIVYSQNADFDPTPIAKFIKQDAEGGCPDCINGRRDIVEKFAPFFPSLLLEPCYMCKCSDASGIPQADLPGDVEMRLLGENDYDELLSLFAAIEEFSSIYGTAELREKGRLSKVINAAAGCVTYGLYKDGRLVSTVADSAACNRCAMVVGVATAPDQRGRGYATAVVSRMCRDLLEGGMEFLCLFYDNPDAGRIYRRIGFRDIAPYAMLR